MVLSPAPEMSHSEARSPGFWFSQTTGFPSGGAAHGSACLAASSPRCGDNSDIKTASAPANPIVLRGWRDGVVRCAGVRLVKVFIWGWMLKCRPERETMRKCAAQGDGYLIHRNTTATSTIEWGCRGYR